MEAGATLVGFLLGGPLGLGTVVFAFGLGPAVGYWFRVVGVQAPTRKRASATVSSER